MSNGPEEPITGMRTNGPARAAPATKHEREFRPVLESDIEYTTREYIIYPLEEPRILYGMGKASPRDGVYLRQS